MAKCFYVTRRLIACDIGGHVIVTLCFSVLGKPRSTGAKISSVVILGQQLIHFIRLPQSHAATWERVTGFEAFRKQKCALTAIRPPSLPSPLLSAITSLQCFMLTGAGQRGGGVGGWIHYRSVQVPNLIFRSITLKDVSRNVK